MSNADEIVQSWISCLADDWIQVRRRDGTLLGVLPRQPEGAASVWTDTGRSVDIAQGLILGVIVPDDCDPREFGAFVARKGQALDALEAADGSLTGVEDQEPA